MFAQGFQEPQAPGTHGQSALNGVPPPAFAFACAVASHPQPSIHQTERPFIHQTDQPRVSNHRTDPSQTFTHDIDPSVSHTEVQIPRRKIARRRDANSDDVRLSDGETDRSQSQAGLPMFQRMVSLVSRIGVGNLVRQQQQRRPPRRTPNMQFFWQDFHINDGSGGSARPEIQEVWVMFVTNEHIDAELQSQRQTQDPSNNRSNPPNTHKHTHQTSHPNLNVVDAAGNNNMDAEQLRSPIVGPEFYNLVGAGGRSLSTLDYESLNLVPPGPQEGFRVRVLVLVEVSVTRVSGDVVVTASGRGGEVIVHRQDPRPMGAEFVHPFVDASFNAQPLFPPLFQERQVVACSVAPPLAPADSSAVIDAAQVIVRFVVLGEVRHAMASFFFHASVGHRLR